MIDVLDHNGVMTGETLERSEVHKLGRWHRAVHLYLIDSKNNLLMQKRSEKIDHYPNQLSISVTGHVDAGEFSQQAMEREIHEGGGVEPSKLNLKFMFSIKSEFAISADYIDRQFNDVYIGKVDELKLEEVHFNIQEVEGLAWVPLRDFWQSLKNEKTFIHHAYIKEFINFQRLFKFDLN